MVQRSTLPVMLDLAQIAAMRCAPLLPVPMLISLVLSLSIADARSSRRLAVVSSCAFVKGCAQQQVSNSMGRGQNLEPRPMPQFVLSPPPRGRGRQ